MISGETMSIFEPIPRESHSDEDAPEFDEALSEEVAPDGQAFDPRSIIIAGLVVAGIVVTGLVVSNLARQEAQPRPLVAARVDPGAAEVEQAEINRPVPTVTPSASASAGPVEEADPADDLGVDSDTDGLSQWQQPQDASDDDVFGGSKWDDKPGRGHGRGNR